MLLHGIATSIRLLYLSFSQLFGCTCNERDHEHLLVHCFGPRHIVLCLGNVHVSWSQIKTQPSGQFYYCDLTLSQDL